MKPLALSLAVILFAMLFGTAIAEEELTANQMDEVTAGYRTIVIYDWDNAWETVGDNSSTNYYGWQWGYYPTYYPRIIRVRANYVGGWIAPPMPYPYYVPCSTTGCM